MTFQPEQLRSYVHDKIEKAVIKTGINLLETGGFQVPANVPKNIEIGIYNYCMQRAKEKQREILYPPQPQHVNTLVRPDWECKRFRSMYKHKALSVIFTIEKYPKILVKLIRGKFPSWKLAYLKPWEVDEPRWAPIFEKIAKKDFIRLAIAAQELGEDYKGLMQCKACRGYKTTYYSIQTRSADEPMTHFWTCLNCNNRWKT